MNNKWRDAGEIVLTRKVGCCEAMDFLCSGSDQERFLTWFSPSETEVWYYCPTYWWGRPTSKVNPNKQNERALALAFMEAIGNEWP